MVRESTLHSDSVPERPASCDGTSRHARGFSFFGFAVQMTKSLPVQILAVAFLFTCGLTCLAYTRTGSLSDVPKYLGGERLLFSPVELTFDGAHVGQQRTLVLDVANFSGQPIQLLGVHESCSCVAIEGFPITLAPRERRGLPIVVDFSRPGPFQEQLIFWTDCPGKQRVEILISGQVER